MASILSYRMLTPIVGAMLLGGLIAVASFDSDAASAGTAANGATTFKVICAVCHATTAKGGPSVGPRLLGIVGRKAGTQPGHNYSTALKKSGIVWTEANLKAFITDPKSIAPGNHMPFAGDRNPAEVDALVAYLKTLQ